MHQQELDGLQQNLEQQKKNLIVTYEGKQIEL